MCLSKRVLNIHRSIKSHKAGKAKRDDKNKKKKMKKDKKSQHDTSFSKMTSRQRDLFLKNWDEKARQIKEEDIRKEKEKWKKCIFDPQYSMVHGHWVPSLEILYPEYPSYIDPRRPNRLNFDSKHIGNFSFGKWVHEPENQNCTESGVTIMPGHFKEIDIEDYEEFFGWKLSHMDTIEDNDEVTKIHGYAIHCIDYILNYNNYRIFHDIGQINGCIGMRPHPDNTQYLFDFRALWKLIFSTTLMGGTDAKRFHEYMQQFIITYRGYEVILLAHLMKVLDLNVHYDVNGDGHKVEGELVHNIDEYGFNNKYGLDIWTKEHNPNLYIYY